MRHPITKVLSHGLENHRVGQPIIVLLHGYGSNENDLTGIVPHLGIDAPWVSLRGGLDTAHGGAAWFQLAAPGIPDPNNVIEATDAIWQWIDENLPNDAPLIAIGFSQGGLMVSQLLRTRPERIAKTVILAGFVLQVDQPGDAVLSQSKPKVIYCRGLQDGVIAPVAVERTYNWLATHTGAATPTYEGLGHGIDMRVLADVAEYLRA